jgi:DNA invertase Pin-like site-specific DNA recombinase
MYRPGRGGEDAAREYKIIYKYSISPDTIRKIWRDAGFTLQKRGVGAKISEEKILEIRKIYSKYCSLERTALACGVNATTVSKYVQDIIKDKGKSERNIEKIIN